MTFTAHPEDYTFLNLRTQNLEYTVLNLHHKAAFTVPVGTNQPTFASYPDGTYRLVPPVGGLTLSKWHLECHPSTSLNKDPQPTHSPQWLWAPPCVPQ